ncbi:DUF3653 domain-containing protein [Aeromonas sp. R9-1]|uniref:DUF3653 domain-containing protein n=1 Tax=Aeromonas sp. R9-1 TaxID=3138478 RepID=UPI0034A1A6E1
MRKYVKRVSNRSMLTTPSVLNGLDNMERKITKNFIFRWFECGLSIEETAKLCFVSVMEVTQWDEGERIPSACKRLMRMASGRELPSIFERYWDGWRMSGHYLITPAGSRLSRQRLEIIESIGESHIYKARHRIALKK